MSRFIPYNEIKFVLDENTRKRKRLGKGAYGKVYVGEYQGTTFAVKEPSREMKGAKIVEQKKALFEEINFMISNPHENIAVINGTSSLPANDLPVIVMEQCDCSLGYLLKSGGLATFSLLKRLDLAYQIAKGMAWLHSANPKIVHHDLKLENVLYKQQTCKITDFGLSRFVTDLDLYKDKMGTPLIGAPEVLNKENNLTEKIDVYSFALNFWQLVTCKPLPTNFKGFDDLKNHVMEGYRPSVEGIQDYIVNLLKEMWDHDPSKRPSFTEIVSRLKGIILPEMNNFIQQQQQQQATVTDDVVSIWNEARSQNHLVSVSFRNLAKAFAKHIKDSELFDLLDGKQETEYSGDSKNKEEIKSFHDKIVPIVTRRNCFLCVLANIIDPKVDDSFSITLNQFLEFASLRTYFGPFNSNFLNNLVRFLQTNGLQCTSDDTAFVTQFSYYIRFNSAKDGSFTLCKSEGIKERITLDSNGLLHHSDQTYPDIYTFIFTNIRTLGTPQANPFFSVAHWKPKTAAEILYYGYGYGYKKEKEKGEKVEKEKGEEVEKEEEKEKEKEKEEEKEEEK